MITEEDLTKIQRLVDSSNKRLEKTIVANVKTEIAGSSKQLKTEIAGSNKLLRFEIAESNKQLRSEIAESNKQTKEEIIATLSREISDLSEINQAVIERVSRIGELEKRIIRIEAHLKLDVPV